MCCPLEQIPARYTVKSVAFHEDKLTQSKTLHLTGIVDRRPTNLLGRLLFCCNHLERCEKIAEIVDETFHLIQDTLKKYCKFKVYESLQNLHHAAHHVEHTLHSFCFIGDLLRICSGKFFIYQKKHPKKIHLLRSIARVCHATAHFFATVNFLYELDIINPQIFKKGIKYTPYLGSIGYALFIISLIWEYHKKRTDSHFRSDLTVHVSGFLFDAIPLTKELKLLSSLFPIINKLAALSGIIHAWTVINRLFPLQENFSTKFKIPKEIKLKTDSIKKETTQCNHSHHPHLHFIKVNA